MGTHLIRITRDDNTILDPGTTAIPHVWYLNGNYRVVTYVGSEPVTSYKDQDFFGTWARCFAEQLTLLLGEGDHHGTWRGDSGQAQFTLDQPLLSPKTSEHAEYFGLYNPSEPLSL